MFDMVSMHLYDNVFVWADCIQDVCLGWWCVAVTVDMSLTMSASWRGDTIVLTWTLLTLHNLTGLVLEGECAGIRDIRALHGGDREYRGRRHLHADH